MCISLHYATLVYINKYCNFKIFQVLEVAVEAWVAEVVMALVWVVVWVVEEVSNFIYTFSSLINILHF